MTVGEDLLQDVLLNEPRIYHPRERLFVPVEFSGAAFRFGHSQVRSRYGVNDDVSGVPIFPDLVGQRPVTAALRPDWRRFFHVDGGREPQASKRVDIAYAGALVRLPRQLTGELEQPEHASLAYRDLLRGSAMDLPSGEDVARKLNERLNVQPDWNPHSEPAENLFAMADLLRVTGLVRVSRSHRCRCDREV